MSKNYRIEARVSKETKDALDRKAESFGGITPFLEKIARFDIVIVDGNAAKLINFMEKKASG